ncbi:MAG: hypothetical protein ACRDQB_15420 [Thermocrispum sp.]
MNTTVRETEPAPGDLAPLIDQLTTVLAHAIERAERGAPEHAGTARSTAFHILNGWLFDNRRLLREPAKADDAATLIRTALQPQAGPNPVIDVAAAADAAGRLAVTLGDDFPMAIVWIAAGLDAQLP